MNAITYNTIGNVHDHTGKIIFTFPGNTLLDQILHELWIIIIQYQRSQFAIGLYSKEYPGYRLVNSDEITDSFMKTLDEYYVSNNGLYLMDDIPDSFVGGNNFRFVLSSYFCRCKGKKGEIIKITRNEGDLNHISMIKSHSYYGPECGLYMAN